MPARKKGKGLLSLLGLGRKKVVRRRRGKGIADIIGGIGRGVGGGIGGGINSLFSGLFGGARKPRRRGRAGLLSKVNKTLRDSAIISHGLRNFGMNGLASGASVIGYGRKRRRGKGAIMDNIKATTPNLYGIVKTLAGFGRRRRRRGGERFDADGNELPSEAKEYVPVLPPAAKPTTLLGKINKTLRDSGVISKGLSNFGMDNLASGASVMGYGRRRGRGYRGLVF